MKSAAYVVGNVGFNDAWWEIFTLSVFLGDIYLATSIDLAMSVYIESLTVSFEQASSILIDFSKPDMSSE